MSSKYISLFEPWQKFVDSNEKVDQIIDSFVNNMSKIQHQLGSIICVQDYRNFSVPFISDEVFNLCGYHPENYYSQGIELGLNLIQPNHLSKLLVFQKTAFDFIQKVPLAQKNTIKINYQAQAIHRTKEKAVNFHSVITPLILDDAGSVVVDVANWTPLPFATTDEFLWHLSYINEEGEVVSESSQPEEQDLSVLSPTEEKVLRFLKKGRTSKEIAEELSVSKHTVDTHRRNILKKMNKNSTSELLASMK